MIKKKDLQVYEGVVFLGKNKPQTNCQSNSQSTDEESQGKIPEICQTFCKIC